MSIAMIAKMFGVELPPELLDALPEIAAKLPMIVADAQHLVTTANERVTNIENTLRRIERKLDALGAAYIASQETSNVIDIPAVGGSTSNGNNSSNTAAGHGIDDAITLY